jgi:uncharacterized protein (DUF2384 family)
VASRLGISVARLAPAVGVAQQTLSARPDAKSAQPGLHDVARVLESLEDLLPDERVRMWLQAPIAALGGRTPLDLLLEGKSQALARYVEAVRDGSPD